MSELTAKELYEKLSYKKKNVYEEATPEKIKVIYDYSEGYKKFLDDAKTEREATDAAIALALISSLTDKAVPDELIAIGELGLSGECRTVSNLEQRVKEAARLGFTKAIVPAKNIEKRTIDSNIELIPIHSIYEAIKVLVKSES